MIIPRLRPPKGRGGRLKGYEACNDVRAARLGDRPPIRSFALEKGGDYE